MYYFTCRTSARDYWQLSMYYTYGSIAGICNIVFTVAMIVMACSFWARANVLLKVCMLIGCCLFTVIQPLAVWMKARKMAAGISCDTELIFGEKGVHISTNEQSAEIAWSSIKGFAVKPTMVILYSDQSHGYVLNNKVLGDKRNAFCQYVSASMEKQKKRAVSGKRQKQTV